MHEPLIPCTIMRGGTSKGLFFRRDDLPEDAHLLRDQLQRITGAGSRRGVDGLCGLDPLANKIAVVGPARAPDADVDFHFIQVADLERGVLDASVNCGNILAAVAPFALDRGILALQSDRATVRIRNTNTDTVVRATIELRQGAPVYAGNHAIAGVPGTGAPIELDFAPPAPSRPASLFPSGKRTDLLGTVIYTFIHLKSSAPLLIALPSAFGKRGDERADALNADTDFLARLEQFRRAAAWKHGLGDVADKVSPKVALVSTGDDAAHLQSRYFVPRTCHAAHAATGALTLAVAANLEGTVAHAVARPQDDARLSISHPSGVMDVFVTVNEAHDAVHIDRMSVLRTARKIMHGMVALAPAGSHSLHAHGSGPAV